MANIGQYVERHYDLVNQAPQPRTVSNILFLSKAWFIYVTRGFCNNCKCEDWQRACVFFYTVLILNGH